MLLRLLSFLLLQGVGGLAGAWLAPQALQIRGGLAGMLVAGMLWVLIDFTRGLRVLQWLRQNDVSDVPLRFGLWGAVSERVRRMVRIRERQASESEHRLQDFLAAMQASPNGVVLLDAQGRIEWFNQIAGTHFGLDPKRDLLQHFGNLVRDRTSPRFVCCPRAHESPHL